MRLTFLPPVLTSTRNNVPARIAADPATDPVLPE
jgi:hypothetical protein